jgi:predicted transglutaminase-like cysteine proteinase
MSNKNRRISAIACCWLVAFFAGVGALPASARLVQFNDDAADPYSHAQSAERRSFLGASLSRLDPVEQPTTTIMSGGLLQKWQKVKSQLSDEVRQLGTCVKNIDACSIEAKAVANLIDDAAKTSGIARLMIVNRRVNSEIRPMSDMAQYGQMEFWASPLTTFKSRAGDCEDYAIAKYFALAQTGIPLRDLRIMVVFDHITRENHAVAAARSGDHWIVLDNVTNRLQPLASNSNLIPLFILGDASVQRVEQRSPRPATRSTERAILSDLIEAFTIENNLVNPAL